ncbi:recombinase family protein [Amycolatopsis anabasis]|uniref:recombinase family protein n=1 Tax=Amycolatopsis anabasis TaxID=1840409 RepID=UPI001C555DCE|nr:recombinase family protein [Amycolatopsis anabasis]
MNRRLRRQAAGELPELRVVIYARASKDGKGRKVSVGTQIAQGRAWCKRIGAVVVAVLVDNDLSASRYATEQRTDYEEALRLLATGEANTLWTRENSRAQRELDVFVRLRKILVDVGGFWAYDDQIYDMNDPDDRVDTAEDAVDAERESERLRKRVRIGVEARAMEGLWAGPLSFGLRIIYDPRTGEPGREIDPEAAAIAEELVDRLIVTGNETEVSQDFNARGVSCARAQTWRADHVRKLYELSRDAEGWAKFTASLTPEQLESAYEALALLRTESPSQVAKEMNQGQRAHPMPGRWNPAKIRNIALNPALAGLRVFRGEIIGKGNWPAIITEEKRALVVARLGDPSRRWIRDGVRVKYLLSGIMLCSVCEQGVGTRKHGGQMRYRCAEGHLTRDMAKCDSLVVEAVLTRLMSKDARELFHFENHAQELIKVVQAAQELRARLDAFTDEAADGKISPDRLGGSRRN